MCPSGILLVSSGILLLLSLLLLPLAYPLLLLPLALSPGLPLHPGGYPVVPTGALVIPIGTSMAYTQVASWRMYCTPGDMHPLACPVVSHMANIDMAMHIYTTLSSERPWRGCSEAMRDSKPLVYCIHMHTWNTGMPLYAQ